MNYFSDYINPNWRLWRKQYLLKGLTLWIIFFAITSYVIPSFIKGMDLKTIMIITMIESLVIIYPMAMLTFKRCHDMNTDWKAVVWIMVISQIITILPSIILVTGFLASLLSTLAQLDKFSWYVTLIIIIILWFKKWTEWKNQYWDDPLKKPIWFFW